MLCGQKVKVEKLLMLADIFVPFGPRIKFVIS